MHQTGFALGHDGFWHAPPMDPSDILDHTVDLTDVLGADTLQEVEWVATNISINEPLNSFTAKTATVWLQNGVNRKVASVTGTFRTTGGRTVERTFKIAVSDL